MRGKSEKFDVTIIGAGPAGLASAIWCVDLGLKAVVLEKHRDVGGQLLWTYNSIKNYPGIMSVAPVDLRDRFTEQLRDSARVIVSTRIASIDLAKKVIVLDDGRRLSSKAIVIATGVRRRKLEVPGETEFEGHGIIASGVRDAEEVRNKSVFIVGGGDAALENAISLSRVAREVVVVHRGERFSARPEFIRQAAEQSNISFRFSAAISAIEGGDKVERVKVADLTSKNVEQLTTEKVLIRVGVIPNTEPFREQLMLDPDGYIPAQADCSTGIRGVYAVGDVANRLSPTIATAVGMGATAAKCILRDLQGRG